MMHKQRALVTKMTDLATTASEHLVPRQVRNMLDRTLVDVACLTHGGLVPVARQLQVDVPAVDAWRSLGVPSEFRGRLTAMAVWPPMPALPTFPARDGRRLAA